MLRSSAFRHVAGIARLGLLIGIVVVAARCTAPSDPVGLEASLDSAVLLDIIYPGDPTCPPQVCGGGGGSNPDPCSSFLRVDSMGIHALDMMPGPGDDCNFTGGGGGDGGGSDAPDVLSTCPSCRAFNGDELEKLQDATEHICSTYRQGVKNALTLGEYGAARTDWALRGFYYEDYPEESPYRYSINITHHPGFTGRMETPPFETIGPTQQLIELAGTLVHEYMHELYPGVGDEGPNGIKARTKSCVAGLIGPR